MSRGGIKHFRGVLITLNRPVSVLLVLIGLSLLVFGSGSVRGAGEIAPLSVSVQVHPVTNPLADDLARHLREQLTELPEIRVVDSESHYLVDVFVMKIRMGSGRVVGTVAHTSVFEPLVPPDVRSGFVCGYVMEDLDWQSRNDRSGASLKQSYSEYRRKLQSFMNLWGGDAEELANNIITTVDAGVLEKRRRSRDRLQKQLKEIPIHPNPTE